MLDKKTSSVGPSSGGSIDEYTPAIQRLWREVDSRFRKELRRDRHKLQDGPPDPPREGSTFPPCTCRLDNSDRPGADPVPPARSRNLACACSLRRSSNLRRI